MSGFHFAFTSICPFSSLLYSAGRLSKKKMSENESINVYIPTLFASPMHAHSLLATVRQGISKR